MSLDWFYSSLKSKFRRHGGAKILREFYKLRKGQGKRNRNGRLGLLRVTVVHYKEQQHAPLLLESDNL